MTMIFDKNKFETKKELFDFIKENKETIITQKKSAIKHTDNFSYSVPIDEVQQKAISNDVEVIKVIAVINTTNYMDSHDDVHIDGLWNKTVKENKRVLHLQEHKNEFDKIISSHSDLSVKTEIMKWVDLGFNFEGKTEALIFDSNVKKTRNSFMFQQYKNGWVDNHSVGMQYVKIELAVDDAEMKEEFTTWNKHIEIIANKDDVKKQGYFFAVTEAKLIEGSAVLRGSNDLTPTLSVTEIKTNEPDLSTQKNIVPEQSTQTNFLNEFYKQRKNN